MRSLVDRIIKRNKLRRKKSFEGVVKKYFIKFSFVLFKFFERYLKALWKGSKWKWIERKKWRNWKIFLDEELKSFEKSMTEIINIKNLI